MNQGVRPLMDSDDLEQILFVLSETLGYLLHAVRIDLHAHAAWHVSAEQIEREELQMLGQLWQSTLDRGRLRFKTFSERVLEDLAKEFTRPGQGHARSIQISEDCVEVRHAASPLFPLHNASPSQATRARLIGKRRAESFESLRKTAFSRRLSRTLHLP